MSTFSLRKYSFTLSGITSLLMHNDNIAWADMMEEWRLDPVNKSRSKAGDDRTPAFRWLGALYDDGKHVCMPQECVSRSMTLAATAVPVPGGRSGKSFKEQSQSGIQITTPDLTFFARGRQIPMEPLLALQDEPKFSRHVEAARGLGFDLDVRRARVGKPKHVRVRPIFDNWVVQGVLMVSDDQITTDVLRTILELAGNRKGIGDWRPGGPTPGPYGRFNVQLEEVSDD